MFNSLAFFSVRGWAGALALLALLALVLIESSGSSSSAATPVVPAFASVAIMDASGARVGSATLTPAGNGETTIAIQVSGLPEGQHGLHIHEIGNCDPAGEKAYSAAGGHFNPDHTMHGAPVLATPGATPGAGDAHAGDLGNITVGADGVGTLVITTNAVTLVPGESHSLNDADGSALVIHAGVDDLVTDPSGDSGARIACGVIYPIQGIEASPTAMP
ncbi:MAG: superoxide dismutase family protein [Thermomicrobiales bacterium]